jgi:DNA-directed RNA polymerase specialized sigma24 family protein
MFKEINTLAWRFRGRCKSKQDMEDLRQEIYLIYTQHKDKYDSSKSALNTWFNNYLFKKVLTYVESAPYRNAQRFEPTEEFPEYETNQLSLSFRQALNSLTDEDWHAITIYDRRLAHHRRGPFFRRIEKIKKSLKEAI